MTQRLLFLFFLFLFVPDSNAQMPAIQATNPDVFTSGELKKIRSADKAFDKHKYDLAISKLDAVQRTHLLSEQLWRKRIEFEYERWRLFGNTPDGKQFQESLVKQCSYATLYCAEQDHASGLLYFFKVGDREDTTSSELARNKTSLAFASIIYGKYDEARKLLDEAFMSDSLWSTTCRYYALLETQENNNTRALKWYERAARNSQHNWRIWEEYALACMSQRQWNDAIDACIEGILIYPAQSFFRMMAEANDNLRRDMDTHWMARWNMPNSANEIQAAVAEEPWSHYRQFKSLAGSFNGYGEIADSTGSGRFLEVASWNYMLSHTDSKNTPELNFARTVQAEGYLDCYVFISMFHINVYYQFQKFVPGNEERIRAYIRHYILVQ